MPQYTDIAAFVEKIPQIPLIDVRSTAEFEQAHIPCAFHLPLLDNDNRKEVGITYRYFGREKAVQKGFDLVGGQFGVMIREAERISPQKEILIYCWRGGMRSGIMGWLLETAGFKVTLLKGGYKSFRNWALNILKQPKNVLIIGGKTGSGKTEILRQLAKNGEQVIDFERLAHHKGSAFGGLGQKPQPRQEHFENLLAMQWHQADMYKILWLENESRAIGKLKIPDSIHEMMRTAPVIEVKIPFEDRVKKILQEYAVLPLEQLTETTRQLRKRLGNDRMKQAVNFLEEGQFQPWANLMLEYYDKFYQYGMEQRRKEDIYAMEFSALEYDKIAEDIRKLSKRIRPQYAAVS